MQENVTTIRMCMPFNYACRLKAPLLWRYSWHSRTLKSPLEVYEKSIGFLNPKKNLLYSVTTTSWQLMLPPNFHQGLEASSKLYTKFLMIWMCLLVMVLKLHVWIFQDGYIAGILSDTNRVSNVRLEQVSKDYPFDISRNVSLESHQNVKIVTSKVLLTSFALNQRECKILYFLKFFWS